MRASVSLGLGRGAQKNGLGRFVPQGFRHFLPQAIARAGLAAPFNPALAGGSDAHWEALPTARAAERPGFESSSAPLPLARTLDSSWKGCPGPEELIHTAFVLQAVKTEQREFVGSWVGWTGSWLRGPSPMGLSLSHICSGDRGARSGQSSHRAWRVAAALSLQRNLHLSRPVGHSHDGQGQGPPGRGWTPEGRVLH